MRHPVQALVLFLIAVVFLCAMLASHQRKGFPLLISEAHAMTVVCNPQPTPHLIGWNRNRKGERT